MSSFFALGLGSGLQHISHYLGRREFEKIRETITKSLLIGLFLGILPLLTL
jgi:Na+-driven multidrug efflux pump